MDAFLKITMQIQIMEAPYIFELIFLFQLPIVILIIIHVPIKEELFMPIFMLNPHLLFLTRIFLIALFLKVAQHPQEMLFMAQLL